MSPIELTDGRGKGWARSQIRRTQESMVLYKSFDTLLASHISLFSLRGSRYSLPMLADGRAERGKSQIKTTAKKVCSSANVFPLHGASSRIDIVILDKDCCNHKIIKRKNGK